MKGVRTHGPILSGPKFLRFIDIQIFLAMVLRYKIEINEYLKNTTRFSTVKDISQIYQNLSSFHGFSYKIVTL